MLLQVLCSADGLCFIVNGLLQKTTDMLIIDNGQGTKSNERQTVGQDIGG